LNEAFKGCGHLGTTFLIDSDKYENSGIKIELDFDPFDERKICSFFKKRIMIL
jgi:hypothetical protein